MSSWWRGGDFGMARWRGYRLLAYGIVIFSATGLLLVLEIGHDGEQRSGYHQSEGKTQIEQQLHDVNR